MKLKQAETVTLEYRADLPEHLSFLSGGDRPWLSAMVKPGGYLNNPFLDACEKIEMRRKILANELVGKTGEEYVSLRDENAQKIGVEMVGATYTHLIDSWSTNIIDDDTGKPLDDSREAFQVLAEARIPEIAEWVKGIAVRATNLADFIMKDDKEAEKN